MASQTELDTVLSMNAIHNILSAPRPRHRDRRDCRVLKAGGDRHDRGYPHIIQYAAALARGVLPPSDAPFGLWNDRVYDHHVGCGADGNTDCAEG